MQADIDEILAAFSEPGAAFLTRPPDQVMSVFQLTLLGQRFEWLDRARGDIEQALSAIDHLRQRVAELEDS